MVFRVGHIGKSGCDRQPNDSELGLIPGQVPTFLGLVVSGYRPDHGRRNSVALRSGLFAFGAGGVLMVGRKMSDEPITLRLRPDVHRAIKELAEAEANTTSAVARRLLTLGLAQVNAAASGAPAASVSA
jgi:hypothetical protein